jgi:3-hydroxyisobutyrate dehydrogenase-like beta-hydroxyacid dehydrogenase
MSPQRVNLYLTPLRAQAVFMAGGVLEGLSAGKGYVDMSTVDEHTSQKIAEAVTAKGGRFLEAPVSGSKKPAIDGQLIILAAGAQPYVHSLA